MEPSALRVALTWNRAFTTVPSGCWKRVSRTKVWNSPDSSDRSRTRTRSRWSGWAASTNVADRDLVAGPTEEPAHRLVDVQDLAAGRADRDPHRRGLEHEPERVRRLGGTSAMAEGPVSSKDAEAGRSTVMGVCTVQDAPRAARRGSIMPAGGRPHQWREAHRAPSAGAATLAADDVQRSPHGHRRARGPAGRRSRRPLPRFRGRRVVGAPHGRGGRAARRGLAPFRHRPGRPDRHPAREPARAGRELLRRRVPGRGPGADQHRLQGRVPPPRPGRLRRPDRGRPGGPRRPDRARRRGGDPGPRGRGRDRGPRGRCRRRSRCRPGPTRSRPGRTSRSARPTHGSVRPISRASSTPRERPGRRRAACSRTVTSWPSASRSRGPGAARPTTSCSRRCRSSTSTRSRSAWWARCSWAGAPRSSASSRSAGSGPRCAAPARRCSRCSARSRSSWRTPRTIRTRPGTACASARPRPCHPTPTASGASGSGARPSAAATASPRRRSSRCCPPGRPTRSGPPGKPNTHEFDVRIVDDGDDPVATGTIGEIVCRPTGPNLMFAGLLEPAGGDGRGAAQPLVPHR